ncbi:AraC family transcriptional regulator [Pinibacter aurantiacus]|uniref:Helix-turn-helix transcriptional regulator n=1 Tax=Pinibacter aurantiacus TaxID=2851599 RepID=A0A9E2SF77_9BACT|nr:AraC family transcriptional regulator [Pinibacter aurantiacus]MBV4360074.1 helix-turn-helix transcriptional regulator [Pinibacter aurantiacus]
MQLEFIRDAVSKKWRIETTTEPGEKCQGKVEIRGEKIVYPESIATGSSSFHKLDDDIDLSVCNLVFKTAATIGRKATEETEFYTMHINCSPAQLSHFSDGKESKIGGEWNSSVFWSASDMASSIKVGAGETFSGIVIHMSKKFLQSALGDLALPAIDANGQSIEAANRHLYNISGNKADRTLVDQKHIISRSMYSTTCEKKRELVQEILGLDGKVSTTERLLIKANILKLLALFIKRISSKNLNNEKYARFSDATKIFEVKKLIDKVAPFEHISLTYLAKEAAICKTKLKTKFKEIVGKTVYQYYLDVKMEKAKTMLEDGPVPISDLAYELGFKSISHFSQAFKKHYGVSPKSVGLRA